MEFPNQDLWNKWRLKEQLPVNVARYAGSWEAMRKEQASGKTKFYYACGHDGGRSKYDAWILCDLRAVKHGHEYDVLLGLPFDDGCLTEVKSKLSLGFFTSHQAQFLTNEINRCMQIGGLYELTYRDFDRLLERRNEISHKLFVRYIYGNQDYHGGFRRRLWTRDDVVKLLEGTGFQINEIKEVGEMNVTIIAQKVKTVTKKIKEPAFETDEEGNIINVGGDFYGKA